MPREPAHVFPLVPRRRLAGTPFGEHRSGRRGFGSDVAGSRPYVRGDPVSSIDWRASARLSSARGADEFVVHERFADEAPKVVAAWDRRPAMGHFGAPFPWLSKAEAARAALRAIAASARAGRAELGYHDASHWIPPASRDSFRLVADRMDRDDEFDAPEDALTQALAFLDRHGGQLAAGAFVFLVSDWLVPPPHHLVARAISRRWEVVPVVVQDPVWEQSFPDVAGVVVPLVDPASGAASDVRLTQGEVELRRRAHEERLRRLRASLVRVGADPVVLGSADPLEVLRGFLAWAERRRAVTRRRA